MRAFVAVVLLLLIGSIPISVRASPTLSLVQLMELGTPALGNGENPAYSVHSCRGGTCRIDGGGVSSK